MQPNNYSIDIASPFQSALQGFQAGAGIGQVMDQRAQAEQQRAAQQQMHADLEALASNPKPTAQDYTALMTRYPQLSEQLKRPWDALNAEQQKNELSTLAKVTAALHSPKPEVAVQVLREQAGAMRNSGDERGSKVMEDMARLAELDPGLARMQAGLMAEVLSGGKILSGLSTLGDEQRAAEQAPADLAKKEADARTATAAAEAAPAKERAGLLKAGADLGLTQAQTSEALKRTEKLGAEIQKAALELEAGGGALDPKDRFDFESKLRKEYSTQTANFQTVKESFGRIRAAQDSGAGDLSLIFSFMKMLDPGSVVREGEFANAENAGGAWDKVGNLYNRVMTGERLSASQRKTFTSQAAKLMTAAREREKTVRGGIDQVVKSYRLNPDNVFYEPSEETGRTAAGAPQPGGEAPAAGVPANLRGRKWTQY